MEFGLNLEVKNETRAPSGTPASRLVPVALWDQEKSAFEKVDRIIPLGGTSLIGVVGLVGNEILKNVHGKSAFRVVFEKGNYKVYVDVGVTAPAILIFLLEDYPCLYTLSFQVRLSTNKDKGEYKLGCLNPLDRNSWLAQEWLSCAILEIKLKRSLEISTPPPRKRVQTIVSPDFQPNQIAEAIEEEEEGESLEIPVDLDQDIIDLLEEVYPIVPYEIDGNIPPLAIGYCSSPQNLDDCEPQSPVSIDFASSDEPVNHGDFGSSGVDSF